MRLKLFVWTWYGFWLYQIYVITDFYIAICWYETFNYGYWSWQYFPANTHMRCCEFLQQTRATFPPAVSLLSATCNTWFSFLSVAALGFSGPLPSRGRLVSGGRELADATPDFDQFDILHKQKESWVVGKRMATVNVKRGLTVGYEGGSPGGENAVDEDEDTSSRKTRGKTGDYQPRRHVVQGRVQGRVEGGGERRQSAQQDVSAGSSSPGRNSSHVCNCHNIREPKW